MTVGRHDCPGDCASAPPATASAQAQLQAAQSALAALTGACQLAVATTEPEADALFPLIEDALDDIVNGTHHFSVAMPQDADDTEIASAILEQLLAGIRERLCAAFGVFAGVFGDMCADHGDCFRTGIPELLQRRALQILETYGDSQEPPDPRLSLCED